MVETNSIPRRMVLSRLLSWKDKPVVKVLTGLRRCGKSTLLRQLMYELKKDGVPEQNILYINKDLLEFDDIKTYKDLGLRVGAMVKKSKGKRYVLLDELQEIEDWEKAIASFIADETVDLFITGSNAHLLSSELATRISGRFVEIAVYPLVFSEFRDFLSANHFSKNVEDDFSLFLRYGGLPGLHRMGYSEEDTYQYLNAVFNTILMKDVVTRYNIREPGQLERVVRFVMDNCGNITSARKIADYLKSQHSGITVDTVINYLSYMSAAFLVRQVRRFDLKGKKLLEIYEKYYMGDIGLRHGFLGYRENDISGLLENIVYNELLYRNYEVNVGKWNDREIDFVAERHDHRLFIQVAYLLADKKTEDREFGPLLELRDQSSKVVLSMDKHWGREREGVQRVYLPDFLLGKTTLLQ